MAARLKSSSNTSLYSVGGCLLLIAAATQIAFAQSAPNGLNRPSSEQYASVRLCRETLSLATSKVFEFEVPANVVSPRLTGMVAASVSKVEVLIFNQQQYADFLKGESGDAVFANEIKTGNIDVHLSSIKGQKYYLVLNNSSKHPQKVWADFAVNLD